jgi:hypothetical protein
MYRLLKYIVRQEKGYLWLIAITGIKLHLSRYKASKRRNGYAPSGTQTRDLGPRDGCQRNRLYKYTECGNKTKTSSVAFKPQANYID